MHRRDILDVLGKRWNLFWKTFTNNNFLFENKNYLKKTLQAKKNYFLGVLHHLTAKFHLKTFLWYTQSKAFLQNKTKKQKWPLRWKLWKTKKFMSKIFKKSWTNVFFIFQNFHFRGYFLLFITKTQFSNNHFFIFNFEDFLLIHLTQFLWKFQCFFSIKEFKQKFQNHCL